MLPCGSLLSGVTEKETWRPLRLAAREKSNFCPLMKSLAIVNSGSRTGVILDSLKPRGSAMLHNMSDRSLWEQRVLTALHDCAGRLPSQLLWSSQRAAR